MRNALLLKSMLERARVPVMLNPLSNTVVFERPRDPAFIKKWQLACQGDVAHVVVMPNINPDKLETFVMELLDTMCSSAREDIKALRNKARDSEK